jgi:hypothetical protein
MTAQLRTSQMRQVQLLMPSTRPTGSPHAILPGQGATARFSESGWPTTVSLLKATHQPVGDATPELIVRCEQAATNLPV